MADEVDALYRVPLGEFTSARNALAKSMGAAGADIKTLEKPTLPAWAVNQLYWHERAAWDAVVKTAVAMRQAHVDVISGRSADVAAVEAAHAVARREAIKAATRLIEGAGEKATLATLEAIAETLQALPSDDHTPGRLTRPLKPLGFGALLALGIPVQGSRSPGVQESRGPSRKEDAERAAARKAAEKALRAAEAAEVKAEAALADAKKAALQADRELARVRDKLVFLEKQRDDAEESVRKQTRLLQEAANARVQAAQDVTRLSE